MHLLPLRSGSSAVPQLLGMSSSIWLILTGAAVSTALGVSLSHLQAALDADDECTSPPCARDSGDGHGVTLFLVFFKYNLVPRPWMHCKRRVRWPRWSGTIQIECIPWVFDFIGISTCIYIYIFIHIIWPSGWGQQCPEQESQWRWALSLLKQTRYMQNFSRIFRSVINEIDWSVPRPVHCICKDHEDKCLGLDTSCLAARKLRLGTSRILGILMGSCVSWSLFSSLVHLVDILYLFHFSFTKICCFLEVLLCKVLRGIHQVLPPLPGTMHSHRCYI